VAALSLVGLAAPAHAVVDATGTVSFHGDAGDYITGGQADSYATPSDSIVVSGSAHHVEIAINGADVDSWNLDFVAPEGQDLARGTYTATRFPFNSPGAGLSLWGNGRACNTLTGTFTVSAITSEDGAVTSLRAAFEQHCEGGAAAAYGEVNLKMPPPPPPLAIAVTNAAEGQASSVDGRAYVTGEVTCTTDVPVAVQGTVTQAPHTTLASGSGSVLVSCVRGQTVKWRIATASTGSVPFRSGDAKVSTSASAKDPTTSTPVEATDTDVVKLKRAGIIS
jgi:hypothetical protein